MRKLLNGFTILLIFKVFFIDTKLKVFSALKWGWMNFWVGEFDSIYVDQRQK
jgi:hypothetical protein